MTHASHNEQYSRRNYIKIFCIPQITPDEDCTKEVVYFVQHNLELDITTCTSIYVNNIDKPMFTCIFLLNHICLMTYVGILHITLDWRYV